MTVIVLNGPFSSEIASHLQAEINKLNKVIPSSAILTANSSMEIIKLNLADPLALLWCLRQSWNSSLVYVIKIEDKEGCLNKQGLLSLEGVERGVDYADLTIQQNNTVDVIQSAQEILDFIKFNPKPLNLTKRLDALISFAPLKDEHFPLIHTWMNTPHVAQWWNDTGSWDYADIVEKYAIYTKGFKLEQGKKKEINSFIMYLGTTPVGYIQYYNPYEFSRFDDNPLIGLPKSLAALDVYIGDIDYIGKGLGPVLMKRFINEYIFPKYEACFVDPDSCNQFAVISYEKIGFEEVDGSQSREQWMLLYKDTRRI